MYAMMLNAMSITIKIRNNTMLTECQVSDCHQPIDGDISNKYCYECELLGKGLQETILDNKVAIDDRYRSLVDLLKKGAH